MPNFRALLTLILLPALWQLRPARAVETAKVFADIELDSAWQYLNAMRVTSDTRAQAILFDNFLDELAHADRFFAVARTLGLRRSGKATQARKSLVQSKEDLVPFFAYAQVSERAIANEFAVYALAARRYPEIASVFLSVMEEEQKHDKESERLLVEQARDHGLIKKALRRARLQRARELWMRVSQRIGAAMFLLSCGAIYLVFGLLLYWPSKSRLGQTMRPTCGVDANQYTTHA